MTSYSTEEKKESYSVGEAFGGASPVTARRQFCFQIARHFFGSLFGNHEILHYEQQNFLHWVVEEWVGGLEGRKPGKDAEALRYPLFLSVLPTLIFFGETISGDCNARGSGPTRLLVSLREGVSAWHSIA